MKTKKEESAASGASKASGESGPDQKAGASGEVSVNPEGAPEKNEKRISPESCRKIGKKIVVDDDQGAALERTVGLISGVGIILGCIIGSGIFISPAGVQAGAGSIGLSLLIWLIAGIFVIFGSFCYIELGLLLRESGGDYSYVHYAFGGFASFIRLWIEAVVVRPGSIAVVALTFAKYVAYPCGATTENARLPIIFIALLMILFITALNSWSIKSSLIINNVCTVAKMVALLAVICGGIYAVIAVEDSTKYFLTPFKHTSSSPGSIALSFYSALFAYQGWNYLNFIVEEVRNPVKTLPRAIIISTGLVIVIYLLVNIAFYTGLSPRKLEQSEAAAIDFGIKLTGYPLTTSIIVSILVAVSCLGSGNGLLFTSSRLFFVGARNDHMPKFLLLTHPKHKTPTPSVVLTGIISIFFLVLSENPVEIINCIAISYWLAIGVATAALFYYRFKIPKEEYPFRVWLPIAIVFFIGCIFLVIFPLCQEWEKSQKALIGLGIMASGIPVYLVFIRFRINFLDRTGDFLTKVIQIVFCVTDETAVKTK